MKTMFLAAAEVELAAAEVELAAAEVELAAAEIGLEAAEVELAATATPARPRKATDIANAASVHSSCSFTPGT